MYSQAICPLAGSLEIRDVVADVEDETPVVAAVLDAAQPCPDHLELEVGAVYRPSDHDSPGLWRVEALPEDSIVHQRLDFTCAELLDDATANGGPHTCAYRTRLDPFLSE